LFARLCRALGAPEWVTDVRFSGNRARLENRQELIALINERIGRQPRDVWIAKLNEAGVPCAPVNTIPKVLKDRQVVELNILQEVSDTGVTLTGLPISFDGERPKIRSLGPRLGQDDDERLVKPSRYGKG
jgi:formyl-CoA transferase